MAAPVGKRALNQEISSDSEVRKKSKPDRGEPLKRFLTWCSAEGLILNSKARVSEDGSCAQYGMIAADDIEEGEVLFEIPRSMLLTPETSDISKLLADERASIEKGSGWVPLLLALMYEYTNDGSRWRHYVHLVPDFNELDLPMFWSSEELAEELRGTGVAEAVRRDITSLTKEFVEIVFPFVKKHSTVFKPICQDIEFYKKMVAFVMAYSFTDKQNSGDDIDDDDDDDDEERPSPPMMVPMADILNHVSASNAQMFFGKEGLKMTANRNIKQGEEVYNTYGCNSNSSLLQMYGFAERYPNNTFDTVEFPASRVLEVCSASMKTLKGEERKLIQQKWKFLEQQGIISDGLNFVLGTEGFATEEEMYHTLKIMVMTEKEFEVYKENEGWDEQEDDEDENSDSLTFEKIKMLPSSSKHILERLAETLLSGYKLTQKEEEAKQLIGSELTRRQRYSSYVRHGQMKLIALLQHSCTQNCAA